MTERGERERKRNRIFTAVVVIIAVAAIAAVAFRAFSTYRMYRESHSEYDSLISHAVSENEEARYDQSLPPVSVDFDYLTEKNQDTRAWICMNQLGISYPVVRGVDNYLYRNETFLKNENNAGCIFIDYRVDSGFNDPNTVIYGESIKNGSMFGSLNKLTSENIVRSDPYVWIMLPDKSLRYRIFSIHEDTRGIGVYSFFNGKDSGFVEYAKKMASESDIPLDIPDFNKDSRIITLSAETNEENGNYVVQALLDKTLQN
ncbi:MAG: class B sortase [Eubacteriales bacterium]|nr:class B sortase [Eubacteriales bacterium]